MSKQAKEYNKRINVFNDTIKYFRQDSAYNNSNIYNIIDIQILLKEIQNLKLSISKKKTITIYCQTTNEAIVDLSDNGLCVALNFANRYTPGGGVTKGSVAQEEDLCRTSSLYLSLLNGKYPFNWKQNLKFTEHVEFIKDDSYNSLKHIIKTSIITAAAPDLKRSRYIFSDDDIAKINMIEQTQNKLEAQIMLQDIENYKMPRHKSFDDLREFIRVANKNKLDDEIFNPFKNMIKCIAKIPIYYNNSKGDKSDKRYDYLILGAIGLGAFKLNPYIEKLMLVAEQLDMTYDEKIATLFFHAIIEDNVFTKYKEIRFAIPQLIIEDTNYNTFVRIFSKLYTKYITNNLDLNLYIPYRHNFLENIITNNTY